MSKSNKFSPDERKAREAVIAVGDYQVPTTICGIRALPQ